MGLKRLPAGRLRGLPCDKHASAGFREPAVSRCVSAALRLVCERRFQWCFLALLLTLLLASASLPLVFDVAFSTLLFAELVVLPFAC